MIEVPSFVLKKLQCVQCGGYLSCGPLVINEKNEQLCGRCFRILPDQIKTQCVRQIGLEAVAEILIFPCRYNIQGCTYTFTWNNGTNHETSCPHRYNTLPLEKPNNNCQEIDLNISCWNHYENEDSIRLNIDVVGKNENKLCLNEENVRLNIELAVCLNVTPRVTYSYVNIEKQINEQVYDTISTISQDVRCTNCHKNLLTSEVFHCGFGHSLCKFCKNNSCNVCGVVPTSEAQHYCKNYRKGCRTLFSTSDVNKHEIDCEFNDFQCRLCEFTNTLDNLVDHFIHHHGCILSNELTLSISRKDSEWYFSCFNRLFHCKYYYFLDQIEFIVSYIGSNDNAAKHKYEITLLSESTKITKRAKCLGWNEVLLNEGITFELINTSLKNLQVRITIL